MRDRLDQLLDRLTVAWEGLNERERVMVAALGAVAVFFVLFVTTYLFHVTEQSRREGLDELRSILTEIELAAADYGAREGERRASELRLDREVPSLKGHLEEVADAAGTPIDSFGSEKRALTRGKKYDEVAVEVKFRRVELSHLTDFMQRLESDRRYAFIIKHLNMRVDFSNKDLINATLEVATYARIGGPDPSADDAKGTDEAPVKPGAGKKPGSPGAKPATKPRPPVDRPASPKSPRPIGPEKKVKS